MKGTATAIGRDTTPALGTQNHSRTDRTPGSTQTEIACPSARLATVMPSCEADR
jgi:hypothetical protein